MSGYRRKQAKRHLPLPILALVLSFATPPELSLDLGGLRLSPYRVVVIGMLFPCLYRLVSGVAGKANLADYLMFFHCCWVMLALINYAGVAQGLESGGIYLCEALGGYLIARCLIRNSEQFVATARLMVGLVVVMMLVAAVESVSGNHFIRDASRAVFGGPPLPFIEPRLGLHRAFTSFDHPILYGIFCASTLGMAVYLPKGNKRRLFRSAGPAVSIVATFFSLSSGAFSALGVQIFLVGWDTVTRGIAGRWHLLMGIIGVFWTGLTLASNRGPVKVFLTYFTFSPGTGYNRASHLGVRKCGSDPPSNTGNWAWRVGTPRLDDQR